MSNDLCCDLCQDPLTIHFVVEPKDIQRPNQAFLAKYEGKSLCLECLGTIEIEHIEGIPLEDLPLLVNHHWLTVRGTQRYKERLSGNPVK